MEALIGREREIHALNDLIDGVNDRGAALMVRGEAGVGKSALLASTSARASAQGMLVLSAIGAQADGDLTETLQAATLACAIGASPEGTQQPEEAVIERLRDKHALLLLDNLKRLLPATPFLADLLAACPRLAILATSHALLQIRGEQTLPLAPLALPPESAFPLTPDTMPTPQEFEALALINA
jgi:non-specific serine/threonine protein kinase